MPIESHLTRENTNTEMLKAIESKLRDLASLNPAEIQKLALEVEHYASEQVACLVELGMKKERETIAEVIRDLEPTIV